MHRAKFVIDRNQLKKILGIPEDSIITGIKFNHDVESTMVFVRTKENLYGHEIEPNAYVPIKNIDFERA